MLITARFAASDISDTEVRQMLQRVLTQEHRSKNTSAYIDSVNRERGELTYNLWGEAGDAGLYRASFSLSDDYVLTIGEAQKVVAITRYEPVRVEESSSAFSLHDATDPLGILGEFRIAEFERRVEEAEAVYSNSLLFRAGHYPDKGFSMSPEELAAAASDWVEPKGNIQHSSFMAGRAGRITRAWTDPTDPTVLRGEVRIPLALDNLLGTEEKRLSMEWGRETKRPTGFALVTNPRITDAALMSLEASLSPAPAPSPNTGEKRKITTKMKLSQLFPTLLALFAGQQEVENDLTPEQRQAIGFTDSPTAPSPTAPPAESQDPRFAQLTQQLAQERALRLQSEAAAFASEAITHQRILPSEQEGLIERYLQAAQDDQALPRKVAFSHAGEQREGSRVDALRAEIVARAPHQLTQDLWPAAPFDGALPKSASATEQPAVPITFSAASGGRAPRATASLDPHDACRKATGGTN